MAVAVSLRLRNLAAEALDVLGEEVQLRLVEQLGLRLERRNKFLEGFDLIRVLRTR